MPIAHTFSKWTKLIFSLTKNYLVDPKRPQNKRPDDLNICKLVQVQVEGMEFQAYQKCYTKLLNKTIFQDFTFK